MIRVPSHFRAHEPYLSVYIPKCALGREAEDQDVREGQAERNFVRAGAVHALTTRRTDHSVTKNSFKMSPSKNHSFFLQDSCKEDSFKKITLSGKTE